MPIIYSVTLLYSSDYQYVKNYPSKPHIYFPLFLSTTILNSYVQLIILHTPSVHLPICDWICKKGSYTCNYKYLEIQF